MQFYIIQFVAVERTLNIITSTAHKLNFRVCAHFTKCHEVALFLMTFCIFTVNLIEEFPSCHAGLPNVPCGTVALWWVMNQAEKCFHLLWGLKDICNLWPSQAQQNINNFTKKKRVWFDSARTNWKWFFLFLQRLLVIVAFQEAQHEHSYEHSLLCLISQVQCFRRVMQNRVSPHQCLG